MHTTPLSTLGDRRNQKFTNYTKKHIENGKISCRNNYKVGDKVLMYKNGLQDKFASNWKDGFIIEKRIREDAYEISEGNKKYSITKRHLKINEEYAVGEGVSQ